MFTHNVIAWGSRAGYDSEAEAVDAALALVVEHGVRADVEEDRRDVVTRSFVRGPDGDAMEIPVDSCGVVVGTHLPCVRGCGCVGPHDSPETIGEWRAVHAAPDRKVPA